ncbi:hypothetical protein [Kribbella catacumbae]|uniref:hypothetical protein n=1 Tax=Kribbella catacumbae TaxID=460086 RepID=UPI000378E96E|nr:hypothetical protein [Kribbella catacumbae]
MAQQHAAAVRGDHRQAFLQRTDFRAWRDQLPGGDREGLRKALNGSFNGSSVTSIVQPGYCCWNAATA